MTATRPWLRRLGIAVALVMAALVNGVVLMTAWNVPASAARHPVASHPQHSTVGLTAPASGQPAQSEATIAAASASTASPTGSTKCACKCSTHTAVEPTGGTPVLAAASGTPPAAPVGSSPAANTPEVPWPGLLGVVGLALLGGTIILWKRSLFRSSSPKSSSQT
jgi:hypothetical protein